MTQAQMAMNAARNALGGAAVVLTALGLVAASPACGQPTTASASPAAVVIENLTASTRRAVAAVLTNTDATDLATTGVDVPRPLSLNRDECTG